MKVSVIIPVFNVEPYLKKCLDSAAGQSYRDIEIVLVDDGSTDGSGAVCDEYAGKDDRIKVIHKENGGPASARESGLKAASGDYIMFADGDDWLSGDAVETCVKAVRKYPSLDYVIFSYVREYPDHSVPTHIFDRSMHLKGRALERMVYRRLFGLHGKEMAHPERMETMAGCWTKMYSAACARNGAFFDLKEIGSGEDALFNMYALYGMREAVYIDRCLYHYRKRDDSLTGAHRPELRRQWRNLFRIMGEIIEEKRLDDTYREVLSNRIALSITAISLNEIFNREQSAFEQMKAIRSYLRDPFYAGNCRKVSVRFLPAAWKMYIICAKLRLSLPIYFMSRAIAFLRKR